MSIFAISDLHLSLSCDKPMHVFGSCWENYEEKMQRNWNRVVTDEDLVLIPGDISWAMYLQEVKADFSYIHQLNGQKLLLRGNHDYWWTTLSKMEQYVEENGFDTIHFLKNTAFMWGDTAICGTRGWPIAHPGSTEENRKIYERERIRTVLSLEEARRQKSKEIIAAFHYPPLERGGVSEGFLDILRDYHVGRCVFGHLHAAAHQYAPQGNYDGITLSLVSCDYLNFTPLLVKK